MTERNREPVAAEPSEVEQAFQRIGIAAAVITVIEGGELHGSTGMAWAEHAEPPLLLTTLRRSGTTMRMVRSSGSFGVSVLAAEQHALVWALARSIGSEDRLHGVDLTPGPALGIPLLGGSVARFECRVVDTYPFGGHDIVLGSVESASTSVEFLPVIHCAHRLWSLTPIEEGY